MEGNFSASREELYHIQMEVKHVQAVQTNHADRLLRLEKRQADDAALKSVWTSPFPSVLGGTPQQGPVRTQSAEVFDDFDDEQSQSLLGGLHIDADEEPVRRGASRANSVRFDVSAIQGSSWAQGSRSSGEFAPARPNSGIGSHPMIERSLSHKSDGRHSSAGHSVHSAPSGRTSSLGLDTNFMIGAQDDESPMDVPEPSPGLFILGTVPSIIRCWLNQSFSHSALLYAVISTGSQKSQLDFSLVKELGLQDHIQSSRNGTYEIRLPVYLPEAVVTQPLSRTNSPAPRLPTLTATFEVLNISQPPAADRKKTIRVFLGSDTLRAHSADLLFSRNLMTLYGDDKNKVSVPFVRPEDDSLFKNLRTTNFLSEIIELKATVPTSTSNELKLRDELVVVDSSPNSERNKSTAEVQQNITTASLGVNHLQDQSRNAEQSTQGLIHEAIQSTLRVTDTNINYLHEPSHDDGRDDSHNLRSYRSAQPSDISSVELDRRESSSGIWGSWRTASISNGHDASRESTLGGYQRVGRGGKSMKILKTSKTSQAARSTSSARTGPAYEAPPQRISGDYSRKSQSGALETSGGFRWESKKTVSEEKASKENVRPIVNASRSSNPIGGASAFAWMNSGKSLGTQATAE